MPRTEQEINSQAASDYRGRDLSGIPVNALISVILGVLTATSIGLLVFQTNRALQLRIEAVEVWADYQVKIVKASVEEDPNLKAEYSEENNVLLQHAQDLKQKSANAKYSLKHLAYAAALILLGTSVAALSLLVKIRYISYVGLLLGLIGAALSVKSFL